MTGLLKLYHKISNTLNIYTKTHTPSLHRARNANSFTYIGNHDICNVCDSKYVDERISTLMRLELTHCFHFDINHSLVSGVIQPFAVDIYCPNNTPRYKLQFMQYMFCAIVEVLLSLSGGEHTLLHLRNVPLNIKVYLTSHVKRMCDDGSHCVLHPIHVNSGVTTVYHNRSIQIVVFRYEEVIKVFIHEMIHALRVDMGLKSFDYNAEKPLMARFATGNEPLVINESFTDTWACLINTCIFTWLYTKTRSDAQSDTQSDTQSDAPEILKHSFDIEKEYIIDKGKSLYNHIMSTISDNGKFVEKSHVISYYILKAANFANIERFLSMYLHNTNAVVVRPEPIQYAAFLEQQLEVFNETLSNHSPKLQHIEESMKMTRLDCMIFLKRFKNKVFKTIVV